jgi:hypothetical protein
MAFSVSRCWAGVTLIARCFAFVAWISNSCAEFLQRQQSWEICVTNYEDPGFLFT